MPKFVTADQLFFAIQQIKHALPNIAYYQSDEDKALTTGDKLPHTLLTGKLQHIIWRTADSIPQEEVQKLNKQKDIFYTIHPEPCDNKIINEYRNRLEKRINAIIDKGYGKCPLRDAGCRKIIKDKLLDISPETIEIYAFVIMPNHIHLLMRNFDGLEKVMHDIKGVTSQKINRLIGKSGSLWHKRYFDRMIRTENQLESTLYYIVNNPRYIGSGEYTIWVKNLGEIYWSSLFHRR